MKRRTKVMMITTASGIYKTTQEAIKEANAIKIWLVRLCKSKGYSCQAIIGVSENNPKSGSMALIKSGKRGRPRKVFKRTNYYIPNHKTQPHIHIVLYGNPADTLCSLLSQKLKNKYLKNILWCNDCCDYIEEAVCYVLKQSKIIRKADVDEKGILTADEYGFYKALEEATASTQTGKIIFTLSKAPAKTGTPDTTKHPKPKVIIKELQCNMNIYKYILVKRKNIYLSRLNKIRQYIPP